MNLSDYITIKTIEIEGKKYTVEIYPSPRVRDSEDLYFYISSDEENFGFTIGISGTVIAIWKLYDKPNELENTLINLSLEKIKLEIVKGNKQDGYDFIFTSDIVKPTPEETIQNLNKINFSMTDEGIRREILQIAYKKWHDDPHNFVFREELKKALPDIDDAALDRNIKYLDEKGCLSKAELDSSGYVGIQISAYGVDIIADPRKFDEILPPVVQYNITNVSGNIGMTVVGNQNIVRENNIEIVFSEIQKEVEQSNLPNKKEVVKEIEELRNEVRKETPSINNIQSMLNKIKKSASWIHEKIIKHPIIAQMIAEILTKTTLK